MAALPRLGQFGPNWVNKFFCVLSSFLLLFSTFGLCLLLFRTLCFGCLIIPCSTHQICYWCDFHRIRNSIDLQTSISRDQFERINSVHFADCMKTIEKCLTYAKTNIKEVDDIVLVGGSTRIPKIESLLTKLFKGKQILKTIYPDVAVAHGAVYYAAVLNGDQNVPTAYLNEWKVNERHDGCCGMAVVVPRCSPLPISKEAKNITTVQDNQNEMCLLIYEGDEQSVNRNTKLGELELLGIPPAKCGVPTITLGFDISSDGALTISATESSSGTSNKITIENFKGRFSEEEIEKMINQAAKYKSDDEKHQKNKEAANELIEYATAMKQTINPELSVNAKEEIESEINLAVECMPRELPL
ncbi:putative Heat shock protein 70 family [Medicago truncatula]|uniref:Putative Heat shock protein 70 family n=1 Tax=Medicago truncatula TaxID=3880 RepID=A0A396HN41_MEDTR|nr:putative Heat shock protein 70 family [Medicago truncatula]